MPIAYRKVQGEVAIVGCWAKEGGGENVRLEGDLNTYWNLAGFMGGEVCIRETVKKT